LADRTLRPPGIGFSIDADEGPRLAAETELVLFRSAQEALNNVARHSAARHVVVRLTRQSDEAILTVRDDGQGFDPAAVSDVTSGRGLGIAGMRERASLLGGNLRIESGAGRGTTVEVSVPLTRLTASEARPTPNEATGVA
jgi:signal transduction histidine kinase